MLSLLLQVQAQWVLRVVLPPHTQEQHKAVNLTTTAVPQLAQAAQVFLMRSRASPITAGM